MIAGSPMPQGWLFCKAIIPLCEPSYVYFFKTTISMEVRVIYITNSVFILMCKRF